MTESDLLIYSIYRSKYNRESLDTLQDGMTLDEFLKHKDFISQCEDMEYAANKDQETNMKKNR